MALGDVPADLTGSAMAMGLPRGMAEARAARLAAQRARRMAGSLAQTNATRAAQGLPSLQRATQLATMGPTAFTAQELATMPPDAASRTLGRLLPSSVTPAVQAATAGPAIAAQDLVGMTPDAAQRALARAGTTVDAVAPGVMRPPVPNLTPPVGAPAGILNPTPSVLAQDLAGLPASAQTSVLQRAAGVAAPAEAAAARAGMSGPAALKALGVDYAAPAVASAATPAAGAVGAAETAAAKSAAAGAGGAGRLGSMFATGGRFAKGSMGRAGLYGAAGYLGGQLVNKVWQDEDTSADSALAGAATGAGIGAGIGSVVPVLGTGVGALLGGAAGGLIGYFGPKDTGTKAVASQLTQEQAKLQQLLGKAGLDYETRTYLEQQLPALAFGAKSKADVKAAAQQIAAQIPQLMLQAGQQKAAQAQQQEYDNNRMMAVQALFGPMLQDALTGTRETGANARSAYETLANNMAQVDPRMADLYRARGAVLENQAANMASAYAAQAAMAPYMGGQDLANQVVDRTQNSYANQMAQALAAQTKAALAQQTGATA